MQVISFMAIKGGVGKTTMAFQFAKFLQTQDQKVLMIDLDAQKSLTGTFENEHFNFIEKAFNLAGYNMEIIKTDIKGAVEEGLKYVNNDACFPSIITIGGIIEALKSGKYDINNTSVAISQTGGVCRATNYIAFLKLGLKQAGFANVRSA